MTKTCQGGLAIIALLICAAVARADGGSNLSPFVLGRAIPLQPRSYTTDNLERLFPQFSHKPFDSSGFNALVLPFQYSDTSGQGDPAEALALAFLLSGDLDWAPGSYCTCHAFHAFKASKAQMMPFTKRCDLSVLIALLHRWHSTHGITGELVHTPTGYAAGFRIFDATGKIVFAKDYKKAQSYWELLGAMSADTIGYFGEKPPAPLAEYLRTPRCAKMQSLVDLGRTAFVEEHSAQEMDAYRQILDADPDFADVHTWYAGQKLWHNPDAKAEMLEMGLSLKTRLTPIALAEFRAARCPDAALAALGPSFTRQAELLLGPNAPLVLASQLRDAEEQAAPAAPDLVARATKVAAEYPNSMHLLVYLARAYEVAELGRCDDAMAASLWLAALENRFIPGDGNKADQCAKWLNDAYLAGFRDPGMVPAIQKVAKSDEIGQRELQRDFVMILVDGGMYHDAIPIAQSVLKDDPESASEIVPRLAFSAAMAGDKQTLDGCLRDNANILTHLGLHDALQYCSDRLAGNDPSDTAVGDKPVLGFDTRAMVTFVLAEDDLAHHTHKHRERLFDFVADNPQIRAAWVLRDAYEQQYASPYQDQFYPTLQWLHPDDPWVQQAFSAYSARPKPTTSYTKPDDVMKDLEGFDGAPEFTIDNPMFVRLKALGKRTTSWRIIAAIHALVDQSQFDEATLMARRYQTAASCEHNSELASIAGELLYRIDGLKGQHAAIGQP